MIPDSNCACRFEASRIHALRNTHGGHSIWNLARQTVAAKVHKLKTHLGSRSGKPNKDRFASRVRKNRPTFVNSECLSWKSNENSQNPPHSQIAPIFVNFLVLPGKTSRTHKKNPFVQTSLRIGLCLVWFARNCAEREDLQKWLGERAKGLLGPRSTGLPRVFRTTLNFFCTGAPPFRTNARGVLLVRSKRPVSPSPNHVTFVNFLFSTPLPSGLVLQSL